ncbi:hypothetical protein ACFOWX_03275 [Sphingorhabdus arenilitoris]|uniref:DUF2804 domain-containing protein n=1 Tax=Sphingorhabdus arenilitoris TaxID=1490041 RepID=A0ABV8RGL8_9SPHN
MITRADEYPFHQTSEPMAFAGTDRNFYDRFFFNGYTPDGDIFFAIAFGLYPQLGIMDGAVCILKDGKQHNVRVSRRMNGDRSDLKVGPLSIEILEPLSRSRIILAPCDSEISLDLTFHVRHPPVEEPRFTRRIGTRAFMDYTRMTQNVAWSGTIHLGDQQISIKAEETFGTRDRSWGIRPVGASEPQPPRDGNLKQFFWLWNPCNFEDYVAFSHTNDDAFGRPWNRRAAIQKIGGKLYEFDDVEYDYQWVEKTRRIKSVSALLKGDTGEATISFTTGPLFYMSGLGYTHPVWGHGRDHGEEAFQYDVIATDECQPTDPLYLHIQALAKAKLVFNGVEREGMGVVEQLFIGPHEPTGMAEGVALIRE